MKKSAHENLIQLSDLIAKTSPEEYTIKVDILSDGTIGQHIRHILEFYLLLVSGSLSGTISYDKRERDIRIEKDAKFALQTIENIISEIKTLDVNTHVKFEADYSTTGSSQNQIATTVGRELAYCVEHSIHHQALIKAALIRLGKTNLVDENFGVAYSTIRYREETCAQ